MGDPVRLPRIKVSEAQIDAVVAAFYAKVRGDAVLGPIFFESLTRAPDIWQAHEAKIGRFWRNALLREPVYDGNPMLVHAGISAIEPAHFNIWLGLFDEVLSETLPRGAAQSWSRLAHRVGRGLSMGLSLARARAGGVPDLG